MEASKNNQSNIENIGISYKTFLVKQITSIRSRTIFEKYFELHISVAHTFAGDVTGECSSS
jgi:hypothetical protein